METRARYVVIGLFTLGVAVAGFLFVYWLQSVGGLRRQAIYQIRFQSPVSGLLKGSAVDFNGIRVGEVTDLKLNADDPKQVMVTAAIDPGTPVRADTLVEVEFQGLTGATVISLRGGSATSPPLSGQPPLLVASEAATQSLTQAAREALRRLDAILAENAEPLKGTLGNLSTFSAALARNSDKLDGIVAGLERLTGGGTKGPVTTYDLSAPRSFPPLERVVVRAQLVVSEPGAPIALDTQKIVPRSTGPEAASFANAQWSDTVPKLIQAKVIQTLDNSGYLDAVSRPMDGLAADYQLLIDIRTFQIAGRVEAAEVELAAKVLGNGGRILAGKIFAAKVPAASAEAPVAIAALDEAFGKVTVELAVWVANVLQGSPPQKR